MKSDQGLPGDLDEQPRQAPLDSGGRVLESEIIREVSKTGDRRSAYRCPADITRLGRSAEPPFVKRSPTIA
ncbi:hypothetical protein [Methylocaldum sp.]|uniref:hypothetical protein n=1 Tax=Methylocaldum sp. TaxID=1969727 RepID=UPI002D2DECE3|nr:hypothetical protein [Methylocaldum sp.]HYE37366.1 hypothetical protein [Methylocaldum sp.]